MLAINDMDKNMNDFMKEEIIHQIEELEDQLIVARLLALRKMKNDDISGAYDILSDAIKVIDNIMGMFP